MKRHPISRVAASVLALFAAGCGATVIGGVEEDPGDAGSTTTAPPGDAGVDDDCYACACHQSTDDVPKGCKDVCHGMSGIGQPTNWCSGAPALSQCAACMAAECGVQDPTQCVRKPTMDECACSYTSQSTPAGCADICTLTIATLPDYCDGAPASSGCKTCLADRCGIDTEHPCWQCACGDTSETTPMGCADVCDAILADQPLANFCNGAAPHSQCDLCIADRCGVTDPSQCH